MSLKALSMKRVLTSLCNWLKKGWNKLECLVVNFLMECYVDINILSECVKQRKMIVTALNLKRKKMKATTVANTCNPSCLEAEA